MGQDSIWFAKFERVWDLQKGAVFLKRERIYDHRKDLAELFFREGFELSAHRIEELEKQLATNLGGPDSFETVTVWGMSPTQILKLKKFWLEHHREYPKA